MRKSLFYSPEGDGGQAATFTKAQLDEAIALEVSGLKKKNDELLGKVVEFGEKAKAFAGLDPATARLAVEKAAKAEEERLKAVGDWDANQTRLRAEWASEHSKIVDPLQQEVTTLRGDLFDAVAVRDAHEAVALPTIKGNPKLLLPIIRPELGVEIVDGKRVTIVKGEDGKPRYHPTTNKLVTVADRLLELRALPEYGGAFEGTGGSGGGALGGDAKAGNGMITLTPDQASNATVYQAALKEVGGDYSRIAVK